MEKLEDIASNQESNNSEDLQDKSRPINYLGWIGGISGFGVGFVAGETTSNYLSNFYTISNVQEYTVDFLLSVFGAWCFATYLSGFTRKE